MFQTIYHSRDFKFSDEIITLFDGKPHLEWPDGADMSNGMVDETYQGDSENVTTYIKPLKPIEERRAVPMRKGIFVATFP
uniref:DUF2442 domain-containing protein n=1 Tax=Caenorhabditis tropicalis TaxID=1561998 RepID=A0A1I7UIJ6_9PELO